jgi:hypothetical protein
LQASAGVMSYLDEFWMFGMLGLTIWPLALSRPRLPEGAAPADWAPVAWLFMCSAEISCDSETAVSPWAVIA